MAICGFCSFSAQAFIYWLASAANNRRREAYVFGSSVCPSVCPSMLTSVRCSLTPILCDELSAYWRRDFNETNWHKYSSYVWVLLKRCSKSEVKGQGRARPGIVLRRRHTFRRCGDEAYLFLLTTCGRQPASWSWTAFGCTLNAFTSHDRIVS